MKAKWLLFLVLLACFVHLQCGYILYPERLGRRTGIIDPEVLVMDCAWLLAGVVPGVVALIIDFHTGCIYATKKELRTRRGQRIRMNLNEPAPADAEIRVVIRNPRNAGNQVVLMQRYLQKGETLRSVEFRIPRNLSPGKYELLLQTSGRTNAFWIVHVDA